MIPSILVSDRKKEVKQYVSELSKKYSIPHFYIFTYDPEATTITIDQIREIHKFVVNAPFNKIVIINQFNTAKKEAQNAFLKTLEEHSDNTHFVLVVSTAYGLLPTIESRCHVVRLHQDSTEPSPRSKNVKKNFLAFETLEEALDLSGSMKKDGYANAIDELIVSTHSALLNEVEKGSYQRDNLEKSIKLLRSALSTKALMNDYNVQPEYAFDQLLIQNYIT